MLRQCLRTIKQRPARVQTRTVTNAFAFSERTGGYNNPHNSMPMPEIKRSKWRWPLIFTTAVLVSYASFKYYTHHNFPPEVADKLREGLRAELDGGGKGKRDFNMALEKYLEALQIADDLDMDHITDEYTGLQIKICEMYEKLGMEDAARLMYREMGVSYVQALTQGSVPAGLRPHLIQRDLRVALKTAMTEGTKDPNVAKMGLLVHFKVAQKEIAAKNDELRELIESEHDKGRKTTKLSLNPEDLQSEQHKERNEAWQPFRDELFSARDMYVALCLATGDVGHALQTKLATTEWMTKSGCDIGPVLMSFYNVGSIFYIQAEDLEVRSLNAQNNDDKEKASRLATDSMRHSKNCYSIILDVVSRLPNKSRTNDDEVSEVQAMSTYGLGVIALHQGELDVASERLREARLRAKGCNLTDLVDSAETELQKVERYKTEGMPSEDFKSPTMDVLLMRKDHEAASNTSIEH